MAEFMRYAMTNNPVSYTHLYYSSPKIMATFKAEVYAHQKRADGTYNIKIRVIHQKRKKYIPTKMCIRDSILLCIRYFS